VSAEDPQHWGDDGDAEEKRKEYSKVLKENQARQTSDELGEHEVKSSKDGSEEKTSKSSSGDAEKNPSRDSEHGNGWIIKFAVLLLPTVLIPFAVFSYWKRKQSELEAIQRAEAKAQLDRMAADHV
jgi:hypothetical protein